MMDRIAKRWLEYTAADQLRCSWVALCCVLYLVNFALYSPWYVEDAAISFSFAHNLASGEGFVAFPGGEPVEGFSNPTWTLLLAAFDLVGVSPWIAAKLLGAGLGLATLLFAYRWARLVLPEDSQMSAVVPFLLALSPQFAIWNASGLENSLFNFLLAAGAVSLVREIRDPGRTRIPRSAIALGLLAISRPEALLYVAIAAAIAVVIITVRHGQETVAGWLARWATVAFLPVGGWFTLRYLYFAWELPNTYYAKLVHIEHSRLLGWNSRGWTYVRWWGLVTTNAFLFPVYLLGATGFTPRRARAGWVLAGLVLLLLIPGLGWAQYVPGWPFPAKWAVADAVRIVGLTTIAVVAPWIGWGRRGDDGRILAWFLVLGVAFFAVYAGGDWMRGYRWFALASVPLAVLLADAADGCLRALMQARPQRARAITGALLAPVVVSGVAYTISFLAQSETTPYHVARRVAYMKGVQERLHLDTVKTLEVDFGGHLWWSGHKLVDLAGLCDVPMARHTWEKPFISEYVFEEQKPDFAHIHSAWAKRSRIPRISHWKEYLEIPGYPVSRHKFHVGNHVRKDLFVTDAWRGPKGRQAVFENNVQLVGWDIPSPQVAAGQSMYIEIGWQARRNGIQRFRALVFLAGYRKVYVQELPPAYDWYHPEKWSASEVVLGRHTLTLPNDLPIGMYDFGVVVLEDGRDGGVARSFTRGRNRDIEARYAEGEALWEGVVEVLSLEEVEEIAQRKHKQAMKTARDGGCKKAEAKLRKSRYHLDPDHPWQPHELPETRREMALCWATQANTHDGAVAAAEIAAARHWDHRDREVVRIGAELADQWEREGDEAAAKGDVEAAYRAWTRTLTADPTRTWVRRRAEEARDQRLGLTGP